MTLHNEGVCSLLRRSFISFVPFLSSYFLHIFLSWDREGRIILKWIWQKLDGFLRNSCTWLRRRTTGTTVVFHKRQEVFFSLPQRICYFGRWLNSTELHTCCGVAADTCEPDCMLSYDGEIFRKLRVIRGFRFLHPEDGTESLSRNVGKNLPLLAA